MARACTHKQSVLVVCPGRGSYNTPELGYLGRHHAGDATLTRFDAARTTGVETLTALDAAAKFVPSLHGRGENAAALIFAASYLDFMSLDTSRFEVVAVTGNSMGWYTALACARAVSGDDGFRIADSMGTFSGLHDGGGQVVLVLTGNDWRPEPALRDAVEAAMVRHGVMRSIDLGGMLVVAGENAVLEAFLSDLPPLPGRAPLRLAGHGPFHTPMMAASSQAALASISPAGFGEPRLPLIDGRGHIWRRFASDPAALHAYTFREQILAPYNFAKAIEVGLKEFAPDRVVLLGPGDSLGAAIGQVLVASGGSGSTTRPSLRRDRKAILSCSRWAAPSNERVWRGRKTQRSCAIRGMWRQCPGPGRSRQVRPCAGYQAVWR